MLSLKDPLMIVTDLDGTLLDHHTYAWDAAGPWLARLIRQQIPIILCSSKTRQEITLIQKNLGLQGLPYIAENGAVIQLHTAWHDHPDFPCIFPGFRHNNILAILNSLRQRHQYPFITFADVDAQTVSEWTGLTPSQAELARTREASETLIWRDTPTRLTAFRQDLAEQKLMLIQGGRFWHVLDARSGKGPAIDWLRCAYQQREGVYRTTIGLGDGPNDASLLNTTDYAVVVKGYSRNPIILQDDTPARVYRTRRYAPHGWCEGLDHFLASD